MPFETMKNRTAKPCAVLPALALALASVWIGERAPAQPSGVSGSNFSTVGGYFDPPNENQAQSLITGAEARPQPGGRYLIKTLKIETFLKNGQREFIIEAPECLYDVANRLASSPGPLHVQSGDGRFSVEGVGFLWQQSQGGLTISNQIRAVLRRAVTNTPPVAPLVITSRWLTFDATNHLAVFHDEVHGDDPDMSFSCGQLAVHGTPDRGSFEVLEAEQSPEIIGKPDDRRATADRMIYTHADERAQLIGNATWQRGRESGRADQTVVYRLENSFFADGHVAIKLPRESLGAGGMLLSGTNAPVTATATNSSLVDLFSDHFQTRSNFTVAEGAVRLVDATNRLFCDKLTVQSATTNAPEEKAIAEGNVVAEKGDGSLRAARAVYTKSDAAVVFTGDPRWTQTQMEGRAERVTIHSGTGEVHAENQVDVKVTLAAQGTSSLTFFPGPVSTNHGPRVIEILAQEFTSENRLATFGGAVHAHEIPITGAESRLQSDWLEVQLAADSQQVERITASNHVVFEQGTIGVTNGPDLYRKLTAQILTARPSPQTNNATDLVADGDVRFTEPGTIARGKHATYTGATDTVRLMGDPIVVMDVRGNPAENRSAAIATITAAELLTWDRAKGRFFGKDYKINWRPRAENAAHGKQGN